MSADSIEVAVVLEDSVLAVEHVTSPRTSRRATLALAGAALLGLLVFSGLAIHAVAVAGDNRVALKEWTDAGGHAFDFRPRRLHPLSDLAAVVSLGTALVCGVWALLRFRREKDAFVVGRGRSVDFRLDVDDVALVRATSDGFAFTPAPGMELPAGPIARGSRLRASLGGTIFLISSVSAPRAAAALSRNLDRRALAYAAASTVAHALLVILFFLIPAEGNGFIVDDLGALRRRTHIELKPQELPRVEPGENGGAHDPGGASAPAERGQRGALGTQQATAAERRGKIRKTGDELTLARPTDRDAYARSAGILGIVRAQRAQLSSVTSMAEFSSGLDEEDVLGGWRGAEVGDSRGWGTGLDGDGPGGGGDRYATIGVGPSRPGPYGGPMNLGPPGLPKRRPGPTFDIGTPTVPEGIDRNMIRRYVRQKHALISHCYERELVANPGLGGTATTAFSIDANGRVISARATGLGAPAVERCVEDVLRSIQFPRSGGLVNVTSYPFTFHRVGD